MIRKAKVCLIGATGVGKSSLVARFVRSVFSERYQTTIGVKIETYAVERPQGTTELVIWDISGEDEFQNVEPAYLRGARGYLLVADGTRWETVEVAALLERRVRETIGAVPFVVVLNKVDLAASWEIGEAERRAIARRGWSPLEASAKTGRGVALAFERLADAIQAEPAWI